MPMLVCSWREGEGEMEGEGGRGREGKGEMEGDLVDLDSRSQLFTQAPIYMK